MHNLLIIDDEESIRDGCRQILSREGYHTEEVGNAVRGLEMALKDVYDIILLDVQMPKMSGLDVLRKLKMESDISAHIIIITGYIINCFAVIGNHNIKYIITGKKKRS